MTRSVDVTTSGTTITPSLERIPILEHIASKFPTELIERIFDHAVYPGKLFPAQETNFQGWHKHDDKLYNRPTICLLRVSKAFYTRYQPLFYSNHVVVGAGASRLRSWIDKIRPPLERYKSSDQSKAMIKSWEMSFSTEDLENQGDDAWAPSRPNWDQMWEANSEGDGPLGLSAALGQTRDLGGEKRLINTWKYKFNLLSSRIDAPDVTLDFMDYYHDDITMEKSLADGVFLRGMCAFTVFPTNLTIRASNSEVETRIWWDFYNRYWQSNT